MVRELTLGFSPCPNDTFMFYPLVKGLVTTEGLTFRERLEDVETLNQLAIQGQLDITKTSYHALGHIRRDYALLRAGSALGRGCGPLLVAGEALSTGSLRHGTIAVPGEHTTAMLLLRLMDPMLSRFVVMPFDKIVDALVQGEVSAGLIIHETRFTYQNFGLKCLLDLGEWWESQTGLPLPLGGIVARRTLGSTVIGHIEQALREGIVYSRSHPEHAATYIREHAQEMNEDVCKSHISLYVNDFSENLGVEGEQAIMELFRRSEQAGLIPAFSGSIFATTD